MSMLEEVVDSSIFLIICAMEWNSNFVNYLDIIINNMKFLK